VDARNARQVQTVAARRKSPAIQRIGAKQITLLGSVGCIGAHHLLPAWEFPRSLLAGALRATKVRYTINQTRLRCKFRQLYPHSGVLCGECKAGFHRIGATEQCKACDDSSGKRETLEAAVFNVLLSSIFLALATTYLFVRFIKVKRNSSLFAIAVRFLQSLGIIFSLDFGVRRGLSFLCFSLFASNGLN
jgi:hypothetical protein